jgi:transglutaminase-like putative cysteine protease
MEAVLDSQPDNNSIYLEETFYCDYSHPIIRDKASDFKIYESDKLNLIQNIFHFVRDGIVFGGDIWKTKASETLNKGYGACYNKNLLLITLLRSFDIPTKYKANPMKKDFLKPAIGSAHFTVSSPFMHCFTEFNINGNWVAIDPTLDRLAYDTFFGPLNKSWGVDWDGESDMVLYSDSIMGDSIYYKDIDKALNANLDSHFLFNNEPDFVLSKWLDIGNKIMWNKTGSYFNHRQKKKI